MTFESIIEQCKYYSKLKNTSGFLFEELTTLSKTDIEKCFIQFKPDKLVQPVNLLRFIIADLLQKGGGINEQIIQEIKDAIEQRDVSKYFDLDKTYTDNLKQYKNTDRGMFPQWKNPFSVLYPFFYSRDTKTEVESFLRGIGGQIINKYSIENAEVHIVGFDGSQYYGADCVWGAVIPQKRNVQRAYQLFFLLNDKGIRVGLYKGEKLSEEFTNIDADFDSTEKALEYLGQFVKRWKILNDEKKGLGSSQKKTQKHSLNQILFGPPGTGKTYNSIKKAVEIANPKFAGIQWKDIKEEFDRLVESGQVVFTTFHQSMSYEDFIEGIKPVTDDENGTVTYEVQKGIFKLISEDAQKNHQSSSELSSNLVKTDFDTLWGILIEQISTTLESGKVFELPTLTNKAFEVVSISDKGNLKVRPLDNGQREYIVSYRRTKKLFEAFPSLSEISNIDKEFRNIIGGANSTSYWSVLNYLQKNINIKPTPIKEEPKNFVLIIDEINRGNISQIFGELITLIEEDKREGKPEALKITLPYSKEKFCVPSNLYIIGTMNTADRSVEALDTALRRRFSFEEMPPKYDLEELNYTVIEDIKATDILAKINLRLEKLLDKDHLIGHSFFICKEGETPFEKVKETFFKNIIPLLQEYFYGDYGKLGLVLGKRFVRKKESSEQSVFAEFEGYESNFNEREVYEIIDYRMSNETNTFANALNILMK